MERKNKIIFAISIVVILVATAGTVLWNNHQTYQQKMIKFQGCLQSAPQGEFLSSQSIGRCTEKYGITLEEWRKWSGLPDLPDLSGLFKKQ